VNILFCDRVQNSDAPENIKSPALSDVTYITNNTPIVITLDRTRFINCIGLGNLGGQENVSVTVNGQTVTFTGNGLYMLRPFSARVITVDINAAWVGRIGLGRAVRIGTAVMKEAGIRTTAANRKTLGGQIIWGAGGYTYRTLNLDSRYQIDETIMNEIFEGYEHTGKGYPFFVCLRDEAYKLPFDRLYAQDRNQTAMTFESGVRRFLHSRRWIFEECF